MKNVAKVANVGNVGYIFFHVGNVKTEYFNKTLAVGGLFDFSSAARPCRRHRPMGRCWIRPAGMSAGYPRSPTGFNVNLLVY